MMELVLCDLWELNIVVLNKKFQTEVQRKIDSKGLGYSNKMMSSFERMN